MAKWHYWPYDVYCENLSWKYLFDGPGAITNMNDPGSNFSVIYDKSIYYAYRKGGFAEAEAFKDCVIDRYRDKVQSGNNPVAPTVEEFASHLAVKMIPPVARAKDDIQREAFQSVKMPVSTTSLSQKVKGLLSTSQPKPLTSKAALISAIPTIQQRVDTSATSPMPMPVPPKPTPATPVHSCGSNKLITYNGYAYCLLNPQMKDLILSQFGDIKILPQVADFVGLPFRMGVRDMEAAGATVSPDMPLNTVEEYLSSIARDGYGAIVGIDEEFGGTIAILKTRDVMKAATACGLNNDFAVYNEPQLGWCVGTEDCPVDAGGTRTIDSKSNGVLDAGVSISPTAMILGAVGTAVVLGGLYWYASGSK